MNPIFKKIDDLAAKSGFKNDLPKLSKYLKEQVPGEYCNQKGEPVMEWIKSCNSYLRERQKLVEWNNGCIKSKKSK